MAEKSLLIACDEPEGELSLAFERALSFLSDDKYEIKSLPYENCYSERPALFLILDVDSNTSTYTKGIAFLRKYWAERIKRKEESPSGILLSFNSFQELIEQDPRYIVVCSKGIEVITIPFSLKDIVHALENNAGKKIDIETMKKYLRWSCELSQQLSHDLKNFDAPYSLLIGACFAGDFKDREDAFIEAEETLKRRMPSNKELEIYHTSIFEGFKECPKSASEELPLSHVSADRKILLIDDECESAEWKETFKAIFGKEITAFGDENWQKQRRENILKTIKSKLVLSDYLVPYDLILLDLYLTDEDRQLSKDYEAGHKNFDDLKELTSFKIIKYIRDRETMDDPIPIILFTASNKAYNAEIMKEAGADYYFPKEAHYKEEDAKEYYKRLKRCIEQLLKQDRIALRGIWRGIKKFDGMNLPVIISKDITIDTAEKKAEILNYLTDAYNFLSSYAQAKILNKYSSASPTIVWLGNLVESLFKRKTYPHIYKPWILAKKIDELTKNEFHAFIVIQLRGRCAHPGIKANFNDGLFTFLTTFQVLNVFNVPIFIKDSTLIENHKLREKVAAIVGKDSIDKVKDSNLSDLIDIERHSSQFSVQIPYLYLFYFWYASTKTGLKPSNGDYHSFRRLASKRLHNL